MGKEKPTSFLWLFLSYSLLHFCMVWYGMLLLPFFSIELSSATSMG
jgi:membrane-anchored glycerophosphoryl diester phosphodiesterase (GDPDase)